MISNALTSFLYTQWNLLLSTFDQPWLTSDNIEEFCHAVFQKSGAMENCFGFVDGTVRPICKPGKNQRVLYNGQKKVHAIKFHSLAVLNGLVDNLFGKRNDSAMLAQSDLYNKLEQLWIPYQMIILFVSTVTLPILIDHNYNAHSKEQE